MSRVWIVEGPDGSGKSTLAQALARETQGVLVHHGSYLRAGAPDLEAIYQLSMTPALHGHADVVLDRCWLSEPIYGAVMRSGVCRVPSSAVRSLERLAESAQAMVVLCLPPFEVCAKTFEGRPEEEYLKKTEQLKKVWEGYDRMPTTLPVVRYDRTAWAGGARAYAGTLAALGRLK